MECGGKKLNRKRKMFGVQVGTLDRIHGKHGNIHTYIRKKSSYESFFRLQGRDEMTQEDNNGGKDFLQVHPYLK